MYRLNEHVTIHGTRAYIDGMSAEQQKGAIDALRTEVTLLTVAEPDPIPKRARKNDSGRVLLIGTIRSVKGDKMILERAKLKSATPREVIEHTKPRQPFKSEDLPSGH